MPDHPDAEKPSPFPGDDEGAQADPARDRALLLDQYSAALGGRGWRKAASLVELYSQINAAAPGRGRESDGFIGDAAHQSRASDHNPWIRDGDTGVVTAVDITHDPKHGCDGAAFTAALLESRDARIKYVIWDRRIFSATVAPWAWRPYTGASPPTEHVHISVVSDKPRYDDATPWRLGKFAEAKLAAP